MKLTSLFLGLALFAGLSIVSTPASATSAFNKQWKEVYLGDDVDAEFLKAARGAGCFVCHVKGEDKKKVRNEYGMAVHEYLDAEKFTKEYIKENEEKAAAEMTEGLKKAGEKKSSDGEVFGEKIAAGKLPATNAGLDD